MSSGRELFTKRYCWLEHYGSLHLLHLTVQESPSEALHPFSPLNVLQAVPLSHYLKYFCTLIHQEEFFSLFCPLSVLLARLLSAPFRIVDKALFSAD